MEKQHVRSIATLAMALSCLPLISACSGTPTDPLASARTIAGTPEWVRAPSGVDCGHVDLGAEGSIPAKNLDCLSAAQKAGDEASLAWVQLTTEGDPIPTFARTDGSGIKVASTSAYDSFGEPGWSEYTCAEVAALPDCSGASNPS